MSTPTTAVTVAPKPEYAVEYCPAGSNDKIKLSASIVRRFVASKTRSGAEASDVDCMKFIALCKARALNPFEGDAYLQGYDSKDGPKFTLITAHQAFLKRAESNDQFDGMESGVVVRRGDEITEYEGDMVIDGDVLIGGWARVHRRDRSKPTYRRLNLKTFNTNMSRWEKDPAGMIVKCAEADALRSAFPNSCGGMYLKSELPEDAVAPAPKRGAVATVTAPALPPSARERYAEMLASGVAHADVMKLLAERNEELCMPTPEELSEDALQVIAGMKIEDGKVRWV